MKLRMTASQEHHHGIHLELQDAIDLFEELFQIGSTGFSYGADIPWSYNCVFECVNLDTEVIQNGSSDPVIRQWDEEFFG